MTGKLPGERLFSTPTRADNRRNIPPTLPSGTLGMFRDHGNTGAVPDSLRTDTAVPLCRATNPLGCVFPTHTFPGEANHPSRSTEGRYRSIAGASWSRLVPGLGFSPRVSGAICRRECGFPARMALSLCPGQPRPVFLPMG